MPWERSRFRTSLTSSPAGLRFHHWHSPMATHMQKRQIQGRGQMRFKPWGPCLVHNSPTRLLTLAGGFPAWRPSRVSRYPDLWISRDGDGTAARGSCNTHCILHPRAQGSQKDPTTERSCPSKHSVGWGRTTTRAAASFRDREMYFACLFPPPKMPLALSLQFWIHPEMVFKSPRKK